MTIALARDDTHRASALRGIEASIASGMRTARRIEFARGRTLARRCLTRLGHSSDGLGITPSGAPAWPVGFVGSISHTPGMVVAAAARDDHAIGVGIDVELIDALALEVVHTVLPLPVWERMRPVRERVGNEVCATIAFSAREALFKASGAQSMRDIQVENVTADTSRRGRFVGTSRSMPAVSGRWLRASTQIYTLAIVPAR